MCENSCGPIFPIEEVAEEVKKLLLPNTPIDLEDIAKVCEQLNVRVAQTVQGDTIEGLLTLKDFSAEVAKCLGFYDRFQRIESNITNLQLQAEIDAGGAGNENKAVSATEYQKEIRVNFTDTQVGYRAGLGNSGDYQTAMGEEAGLENTGLYQTALGRYAGYQNTGGVQTAVGIAAGRRNTADNQSALGNAAGLGNTGIGQTTVGTSSGLNNTGAYNTNLGLEAGVDNTGDNNMHLGFSAQPRPGESNYTVIGNDAQVNLYTRATINATGFVTISDERSKKVGDKVHTMQNGIEMYRFTYLANNKTDTGWIAQQVEELLKSKGFSEDVIEDAIPKKCDVDWQATIKNFNKQIRARISTWPEAQARLDKYVLEKARELGVTEPTVREFLQAVEKVQAEYEAAVAFNKSLADLKPEEGKELPKPKELVPLTDWQEKTYAELSSYNINNYLVCADDIRGINKDLVRDLLS